MNELDKIHFKYAFGKDKFICDICGEKFKKLGPHLEKHYQTHVAEKVEIAKSLQTNILRRFMSEKDIEKLLEGYQSNFKRGFGSSRSSLINRPITKIEKIILGGYLFRQSVSMREF